MKMSHITLFSPFLVAALISFTGLSSLPAALIFSQNAGTDYLTWEAEAVETVPSHYTVLSTSTTPGTSTFGASADSGIWSNGPTTSTDSVIDPPNASSTLFFTLRFSQTGEYEFFLRGFHADNNSTNPAVAAISEGGGTGANDSLWSPDALGTGGTYTGTYTRRNNFLPQSGTGATPTIGWSSIGSYNVTAGEDYTFAISYREDGQFWDRFGAIETSSSLTVNDLDGLPNSSLIPEPAPALLLVLTGALFLGARRRRALG